jgi:sulfate adenylyltransferase subunit 2
MIAETTMSPPPNASISPTVMSHAPAAGRGSDAAEVRFRSLGCYPFSAAVESSARTLDDIVTEMQTTKISERAGRLIDQDQDSSMETKKREGYF